MKQHTPGPWRIGNDGSGPTIEGDSGELVALVSSDDKSNMPVDEIANARLIAAAPELLAALGVALEYMERDGLASNGACMIARAAISKALGE